MIKSVMFICSGNICRSPMAQWYMQKRVKDIGKEELYLISSCGTEAINGQEATENAKKAILEYEVNMDKHRATNISFTNIKDYELIICMTEVHKKIVKKMYPKNSDNIYTLKEYIDPEALYKDIDDPWGLSLEVYKECANEIAKSIDKLIEKF